MANSLNCVINLKNLNAFSKFIKIIIRRDIIKCWFCSILYIGIIDFAQIKSFSTSSARIKRSLNLSTLIKSIRASKLTLNKPEEIDLAARNLYENNG